MHLNSQQLQRAGQAARPSTPRGELARPPADLDVAVIGIGNSGEAVALRLQALAYLDGTWLNTSGLNNDRLPPRPLALPGAPEPLTLVERLVLDADNPRERLLDEPVLARRYAAVLRGISVFETHPRAGSGGHGLPAISGLDIDLNTDRVHVWLRGVTRQLHGVVPPAPGQSAIQRILAEQGQRAAPAREKRVIVIGGACGAMGNAGHQLVPPLLHHTLAEQGIRTYEVWGVLLGPRAFTGLTPYVRHNFRALIETIEHMSRHGLRRHYAPDLEIAMQRPPYDRVFLIDDPRLPGSAASVTEAEMEQFLDQSALSLYLLLRGTIWPTIASHTANDDGVVRPDGRLRYLHTVRGAALRADRAQLHAALAAGLAVRTLDQFLAQFAA